MNYRPFFSNLMESDSTGFIAKKDYSSTSDLYYWIFFAVLIVTLKLINNTRVR